MGRLLCRICRDEYTWENGKFFKNKLGYNCSILCDLNWQFLVPADERKKSTTIWPRNCYKIKGREKKRLQWYTLQKGDTQKYIEIMRQGDYQNSL